MSSDIDYYERARHINWTKDDPGVRPHRNASEDGKQIEPRCGINRETKGRRGR